MTGYHISSSDGLARKCSARTPESCTAQRIEGLQEHYDSVEDAQQAYEIHISKSQAFGTLTKSNVVNKFDIAPLSYEEREDYHYKQYFKNFEKRFPGERDDNKVRSTLSLRFLKAFKYSNIAHRVNSDQELEEGTEKAIEIMTEQYSNMKSTGLFLQKDLERHNDSIQILRTRLELSKMKKNDNLSQEDFEKLRETMTNNLSDNGYAKETMNHEIDLNLNNFNDKQTNPEKYRSNQQKIKRGRLERNLSRYNVLSLAQDEEQLKKFDELVSEYEKIADDQVQSPYISDVAKSSIEAHLYNYSVTKYKAHVIAFGSKKPLSVPFYATPGEKINAKKYNDWLAVEKEYLATGIDKAVNRAKNNGANLQIIDVPFYKWDK